MNIIGNTPADTVGHAGTKPQELDNIRDEINELVQRVHSLSSHVADDADRVFGPTPRPDTQPVGLLAGAGVIEAIHSSLGQLRAGLEELRGELSRFSRL